MLISHVPLARESRCLGSRNQIKPRSAWGYLNNLSPKDTALLLSAFRPIAILSGDHHSYCHIEHPYSKDSRSTRVQSRQTIPEHTVRTFSWMQGEFWPGYGLVSLFRSSNDVGFAYKDCVLPPQLFLLIWDGIAAALSVVVFSVYHIWHSFKSALPLRVCFGKFFHDLFALAGPILLLFLICLVVIF